MLAALNVGPCIPVGLSVGGLRAAEFALRRRQDTPGLVLINVLRADGPLIRWLVELETRLIALPNVVLTSHVGSATTASRAAMGDLVLANIRSWFEGRAP